jgi:hypothetical protein
MRASFLVVIPNKVRGLCSILSGSGGPQLNHADLTAESLCANRALALAASSSRFLGDEFVLSECRSRVEASAISSTAASNAASLAFDGLLNPLIFLTNCSEAFRISSAVTGGSKLNRILMFLHIAITSRRHNPQL